MALRALLCSFVLRQHGMPGVLNATRPGADLSPFERQTLHILSLRAQTPMTWPDFVWRADEWPGV